MSSAFRGVSPPSDAHTPHTINNPPFPGQNLRVTQTSLSRARVTGKLHRSCCVVDKLGGEEKRVYTLLATSCVCVETNTVVVGSYARRFRPCPLSCCGLPLSSNQQSTSTYIIIYHHQLPSSYYIDVRPPPPPSVTTTTSNNNNQYG